MHAWARALVILAVVAFAGVASASARRANKDPYGALFGAVSKASKVHAKHGHARSHHHRSKREARREKKAAALVAEAKAPPAKPASQDSLVLTDYAPLGQHALVGP